MNKNRENRAAIAQETVDILKQGFYQNQQQETINIQDNLQTAIENSIHYRTYAIVTKPWLVRDRKSLLLR